MNIEYPSYIKSNTQLIFYILRENLPLNQPMRLSAIVHLVEERTNGIGISGRKITDSMVRSAIRNNLGKPLSEYVFVGQGFYKRIEPHANFYYNQESAVAACSAEVLLKYAHKAVAEELKLNIFDNRFSLEKLETARLAVCEILDHIQQASELLENFPYIELVVKTDA